MIKFVQSMNALPYMPQAQIDWLAKHLSRDMRVFEWGSGGSTLFIAPRVKSMISIEYGKRWHLKVLFQLLVRGIFNCRLMRILPETSERQTSETETYRSTGKYGRLTFKHYVEIIDSYPDDHFDVIVVDGRCRAHCLLHARTKVKKGGYIFLDDADRSHYAQSINLMTNFHKEHVDRSIIFQRLS